MISITQKQSNFISSITAVASNCCYFFANWQHIPIYHLWFIFSPNWRVCSARWWTCVAFAMMLWPFLMYYLTWWQQFQDSLLKKRTDIKLYVWKYTFILGQIKSKHIQKTVSRSNFLVYIELWFHKTNNHYNLIWIKYTLVK